MPLNYQSRGHWHGKILKRTPWIAKFVYSRNPQITGETLYILKNIADPSIDEGSCVKESTDGDVSIEAVFTKGALEDFSAQYIDDDLPDWDRSLIVIRKFSRHHKLDRLKNNCKFQLLVEEFRLWALQDGFRHKTVPMLCMEIPEIRTVSDELWLEWRLSEVNTELSDDRLSMGSLPLSQLLDRMGAVSDAEDEPPDEPLHEPPHRNNTDNLGTTDTAVMALPSTGPSHKQPLKMRGAVFSQHVNMSILRLSDLPIQIDTNFDGSHLIIRAPDRQQLDAIPEWLPGYTPPVDAQPYSLSNLEDEAEKQSGNCGPGCLLDAGEHGLEPSSQSPVPYKVLRDFTKEATLPKSYRVIGTVTMTPRWNSDHPLHNEGGALRMSGSENLSEEVGVEAEPAACDTSVQVGSSLLEMKTFTPHRDARGEQPVDAFVQVGESLLQPGVCTQTSPTTLVEGNSGSPVSGIEQETQGQRVPSTDVSLAGGESRSFKDSASILRLSHSQDDIMGAGEPSAVQHQPSKESNPPTSSVQRGVFGRQSQAGSSVHLPTEKSRDFDNVEDSECLGHDVGDYQDMAEFSCAEAPDSIGVSFLYGGTQPFQSSELSPVEPSGASPGMEDHSNDMIGPTPEGKSGKPQVLTRGGQRAGLKGHNDATPAELSNSYRRKASTSRGISPLTQRDGNSPLTQRDGNSPLTQRDGNSPLTQRDGNSPLTQRDGNSPLTQRDGNSPLTQRDGNSPLTQRDRNSPLTQRDANSPLTQRDANSPLTQRDANSPLTQRDANSPLTQRDANSPLTQRDANNPLAQRCGITPLTQPDHSTQISAGKNKVAPVLDFPLSPVGPRPKAAYLLQQPIMFHLDSPSTIHDSDMKIIIKHGLEGRGTPVVAIEDIGLKYPISTSKEGQKKLNSSVILPNLSPSPTHAIQASMLENKTSPVILLHHVHEDRGSPRREKQRHISRYNTEGSGDNQRNSPQDCLKRLAGLDTIKLKVPVILLDHIDTCIPHGEQGGPGKCDQAEVPTSSTSEGNLSMDSECIPSTPEAKQHIKSQVGARITKINTSDTSADAKNKKLQRIQESTAKCQDDVTLIPERPESVKESWQCKQDTIPTDLSVTSQMNSEDNSRKRGRPREVKKQTDTDESFESNDSQDLDFIPKYSKAEEELQISSEDSDFEPDKRQTRSKNARKGSKSRKIKKKNEGSKQVLNNEGRIEFIKQKGTLPDLGSLFRKRPSGSSSGRKRKLFSDSTMPVLGAPLTGIEEEETPHKRSSSTSKKTATKDSQAAEKGESSPVNTQSVSPRSKNNLSMSSVVMVEKLSLYKDPTLDSREPDLPARHSPRLSGTTLGVQARHSPRLSGTTSDGQSRHSPRLSGTTLDVQARHSPRLSGTTLDVQARHSPRLSDTTSDVQARHSPRLSDTTPDVQARHSPRLSDTTSDVQARHSPRLSDTTSDVQARHSPRLSGTTSDVQARHSPRLSDTTPDVQARHSPRLSDTTPDVQARHSPRLSGTTSDVQALHSPRRSGTTPDVQARHSPRLSDTTPDVQARHSPRLSGTTPDVQARHSPRRSGTTPDVQARHSPRLSGTTSDVQAQHSPRRSGTTPDVQARHSPRLSSTTPDVQVRHSPRLSGTPDVQARHNPRLSGTTPDVQARHSPRLSGTTPDVQAWHSPRLSAKISDTQKQSPKYSSKNVQFSSIITKSRNSSSKTEAAVTSEAEESLGSSGHNSRDSSRYLTTPVNSLPSHQPRSETVSRRSPPSTREMEAPVTSHNLQSLVDSFEHADSGELEDLQKIKFPESIMQKICSYFAQPQFAPGDS